MHKADEVNAGERALRVRREVVRANPNLMVLTKHLWASALHPCAPPRPHRLSTPEGGGEVQAHENGVHALCSVPDARLAS